MCVTACPGLRSSLTCADVGVNIDTLTKRLQDAEMSLADIGPDYTDDTDMATDGSLPICDIVEQLDDDDHVICTSLPHSHNMLSDTF